MCICPYACTYTYIKHMYKVIDFSCVCKLFTRCIQDDRVHFLEDKSLLNEYIVNEEGNVFVGNEHQISSYSWFYGQVRCYMFLWPENSYFTYNKLTFVVMCTERNPDNIEIPPLPIHQIFLSSFFFLPSLFIYFSIWASIKNTFLICVVNAFLH